MFFYDFEPQAGARPLRARNRARAEATLKRIFATVLRGKMMPVPVAIVLIQNGEQVWRWTQQDYAQVVAKRISCEAPNMVSPRPLDELEAARPKVKVVR